MSSEMIQGTAEWRQMRCGKVGASAVADITAKTAKGYGASRANVLAGLLTERLTGIPSESYTSGPMLWGTETEPQARAAYAFKHDAQVVEAGWIPHWSIPDSGCSPDGLVGDDGLVEIKCPNTSTHLNTLIERAIPGRYLKQMQWQMAVTRRDWCDYVSFDPRLPMRMQLFVKRVFRDEDLIASLTAEVIQFLSDLENKIEELQNQYPE